MIHLRRRSGERELWLMGMGLTGTEMTKRREFLESMGAMLALTSAAKAETLPPVPQQPPKHHIRFAVCGISHDHIHGMIGAVARGGGELVAWWAMPDDDEHYVYAIAL